MPFDMITAARVSVGKAEKPSTEAPLLTRSALIGRLTVPDSHKSMFTETDPTEAPPVVSLPKPATYSIFTGHRSRLIPLQSWEGYVESVDETERTFVARLFDLEPDARSDEERAVFDLSEIQPDDLELLRPGALFRWIIGYRENYRGPRERVSNVIFRRLPAWSARDIREAQEKATQLADALRWE